MPSTPIFLLAIKVLLLVAPHSAIAYVGPGAGITALGTVIALISAILLSIVAFIWYPIKRLLSKIKKKDESKRKGSL